MRDRGNPNTNRFPTVDGGRRDTAQRNLFIGVGGFVLAFIVIGLLLLSGRGDDDDNNDGAAIATNTRSTSPVSAITTASDAESEPTGPPDPSATVGATEDGGQGVPTVTPGSAFPTVTPSDDATEETTDDGDETPEIDDEPEATSTPSVDDEPDDEPIIGDFGQLPPVQIVSGGLGRSVDLAYEFDAASFSAPDMATVYEVIWRQWTVDEMTAIASAIGVDGPVEDLGAGSLQVNGTESALFAGPTVTGQPVLQYENYAEPADEALPDDGSLVSIARAFVVDSGIAPDAGDGILISRDDDFNVAVVSFKPSSPSPILAAYPGATVTLGPGGIVQFADVRWAADYAGSDYSLRATSAMWNDVLAGEASLDADLSGLPEGATSGTFTVTDIGIAYSLAGADYLAPIVVFYGEVFFADAGVSVPMRAYVQAVAGQDDPAG